MFSNYQKHLSIVVVVLCHMNPPHIQLHVFPNSTKEHVSKPKLARSIQFQTIHTLSQRH